MKPAVALFMLLLSACGLGGSRSTGPATPITPATPVGVVEAAKGVLEQYKQAYEVRSAEALGAIYAHTLDVSLVHQGEAQQGWTAVENYLRDRLVRAAEVRVKVTDVAIASLGDRGAVVTASMRQDINDGTSTVSEQGFLTLALRLEPGANGDHWVIASEHFSFR